MATFDVAKLLNKITQDIPGINTVLKALAKWDVSALSDVPDGAMQATTDASNRLTINKKISGSYTPVAKLLHDVDTVDGYHASTSATANAVAVRNASGALPGNILGNAATADTATALATGAVVPVNQGGTGATTASQARTNLGVANGADFTSHIAKQASPSVEGHVKLDALAANGSNTAAPGGYGLGVGATIISDWNVTLKPGWYGSSNSALNVPMNAACRGFIVCGANASNGYQIVFAGESNTGRRIFTRSFSNGTFAETWIELPNGITDSTSTVSSTIAASATAVKAVNDAASDAKTDASTALARTAPATTTSRGIGRVATRADMEPGAAVENGPAFLSVGSVVTPTPTANAVPQADASGTLDAWVTPGANTDLSNVDLDKVSLTLQRVRYQTGEYSISQTVMPVSNEVPRITTGTQFMSINFTPRQAGSRLRIDVMFNGAGLASTPWNMVCAVFQDSIPDALASVVTHGTATNVSRTLPLSFEVTSDSTETRTYSVRAGCAQGGISFNSSGNNAATLGGTRVSYIGVTEYAK